MCNPSCQSRSVHPPSIGARRIPENPTDVECIESMGATAEFAACFDIAALFGRMMGILNRTGRGIRAVANDAYEGVARPVWVRIPIIRSRSAAVSEHAAICAVTPIDSMPSTSVGSSGRRRAAIDDGCTERDWQLGLHISRIARTSSAHHDYAVWLVLAADECPCLEGTLVSPDELPARQDSEADAPP